MTPTRPSLSARVDTRRRAGRPLKIAEGVWRLTGGFPVTNHVYLVAEQGGVTVFDAGVNEMAALIVRAVGLAKIVRVVLGHSHWDHRGAAPALAQAAPVMCHEYETADAQGDGGRHYFRLDRHQSRVAAVVLGELMKRRDGGPVAIADTLHEGARVGTFEVIDVPGHSPGQIALVRRADGVALVSDAIYTIDADTGRKIEPRTPHPAYSIDDARARESIRMLADMGLQAVWPGHADPVTHDVRRRLERAADSEEK